MPPAALTIAGSDSGGGAGIQADIKTMSALGVFATSAITAVTAQNTLGVQSVFQLPAKEVAAQIRAVLSDISVQAIKIGMLGSLEVVCSVREALSETTVPIVLDPVMLSQSGHSLLETAAVNRMKEELLPLATILTPNIPEAAILLSVPEEEVLNGPRVATESLLKLGPKSVLLKGGHAKGEKSEDFFSDGGELRVFSAPRVSTKNLHGTGCTLSSAIASYLALGEELESAVRKAKAYITGAISAELQIGQGHGPVNHFWQKVLPVTT